MTLYNQHKSITLLVGAALVAFVGGAAAVGCADAPSGHGDGCSIDDDCKGSRVCIHSQRVDPTTSDAGTTPDSGTKHDPGLTCGAIGDSCVGDLDCCQTGQGLGAKGATCNTNGTCAAGCATDSECNSRCCSGGACSDPSLCCSNPAGACTVTTDCCQTGKSVGPHRATRTPPNYTCSAICYASSECFSRLMQNGHLSDAA